MTKAGLRAIFPGRNLSKARQEHKKYPYLLSGKIIRHPNQVWATDLTYIKLPTGHMYLMAIIDLYSRKVLNWILTNTLDAPTFANCLRDTIEMWGAPAIFNTDQGCQFTSECWTSVLHEYGVKISMDGKNRALDNIYIERLWRSLKYEDIYLRHYETVRELREGIDRYFTFYNTRRFHQILEYLTPDEVYQSFQAVSQESKRPWSTLNYFVFCVTKGRSLGRGVKKWRQKRRGTLPMHTAAIWFRFASPKFLLHCVRKKLQ